MWPFKISRVKLPAFGRKQQKKKEKENNGGTIQTCATGFAAAQLRLQVCLRGKCKSLSHSDKLPEVLIICPDWSLPKSKETLLLVSRPPVSVLSKSLVLSLISSFRYTAFILFFSCVCRTCASLVSN